MTYNEIRSAPTDKQFSDRFGFVWTYRHGTWGWRCGNRRWHASYTAAAAHSTAHWGPFQEITV